MVRAVASAVAVAALPVVEPEEPVTLPVTFPVTFPVTLPENVAVMVPAAKLPLASRATMADAVFNAVAVVVALGNVPVSLVAASDVIHAGSAYVLLTSTLSVFRLLKLALMVTRDAAMISVARMVVIVAISPPVRRQ